MAGAKEVPKEAALIKERREAMLPRMSHSAAARRAVRLTGEGFSASTWQKIENGDYIGGPDKIAIMALAVGVAPEELEEAGRADAARLLRSEIQRRAAAEPALAEFESQSTPEGVMQDLLQGLQEIREDPRLSPDQKRRLEDQLLVMTRQAIRGSLDQMRTIRDITTNSDQK